jgi:hypothetical protein
MKRFPLLLPAVTIPMLLATACGRPPEAADIGAATTPSPAGQEPPAAAAVVAVPAPDPLGEAPGDTPSVAIIETAQADVPAQETTSVQQPSRYGVPAADPFNPVPPPPVLLPAPPPEPPPPPPKPTAPPLGYSFFGRLADPDGKTAIYIRRDKDLVRAQAGAVLRDGFTVQRVDERQLVAVHGPTGDTVTLSFPPPSSATR